MRDVLLRAIRDGKRRSSMYFPMSPIHSRTCAARIEDLAVIILKPSMGQREAGRFGQVDSALLFEQPALSACTSTYSVVLLLGTTSRYLPVPSTRSGTSMRHSAVSSHWECIMYSAVHGMDRR